MAHSSPAVHEIVLAFPAAFERGSWSVWDEVVRAVRSLQNLRLPLWTQRAPPAVADRPVSPRSHDHRGLPAVSRLGMGRLLTAASLGLALAIVAGWADPDVLLDAFWVTIAVGAFVFTLRVALLRILLGSLFDIAYSTSAASGHGGAMEIEPLDLAEWPLLVVISIIVALMASRVSTTARRYAALYRQASDRLIKAHEEERARLARDLHDSVGQTLTAVILTLDAAEADLRAEPGARSSTARTAIRRAHALAATALDQAQAVATQLRPARIHEIGLGETIRDLADSAGVPVEVRFDPAVLPPGLLEPEQEVGAYRIVQEAVGNAARHSGAARIWIDAEVSDELIRLEVGDDGVGFDQSTRSRGLGLEGMRERADILMGRLDVRSRPGAGTTVCLAIPRSAPSASARLSGAGGAAMDAVP